MMIFSTSWGNCENFQNQAFNWRFRKYEASANMKPLMSLVRSQFTLQAFVPMEMVPICFAGVSDFFSWPLCLSLLWILIFSMSWRWADMSKRALLILRCLQQPRWPHFQRQTFCRPSFNGPCIAPLPCPVFIVEKLPAGCSLLTHKANCTKKSLTEKKIWNHQELNRPRQWWPSLQHSR